jgi:hypothetical protein
MVFYDWITERNSWLAMLVSQTSPVRGHPFSPWTGFAIHRYNGDFGVSIPCWGLAVIWGLTALVILRLTAKHASLRGFPIMVNSPR